MSKYLTDTKSTQTHNQSKYGPIHYQTNDCIIIIIIIIITIINRIYSSVMMVRVKEWKRSSLVRALLYAPVHPCVNDQPNKYILRAREII
jgi:hypothetical protein